MFYVIHRVLTSGSGDSALRRGRRRDDSPHKVGGLRHLGHRTHRPRRRAGLADADEFRGARESRSPLAAHAVPGLMKILMHARRPVRGVRAGVTRRDEHPRSASRRLRADSWRVTTHRSRSRRPEVRDSASRRDTRPGAPSRTRTAVRNRAGLARPPLFSGCRARRGGVAPPCGGAAARRARRCSMRSPHGMWPWHRPACSPQFSSGMVCSDGSNSRANASTPRPARCSATELLAELRRRRQTGAGHSGNLLRWRESLHQTGSTSLPQLQLSHDTVANASGQARVGLDHHHSLSKDCAASVRHRPPGPVCAAAKQLPSQP